MTRIAIIGAVAFAALSMTSAAGAQSRPQTEQVARPILVCASNAATQRAFRREHGARPQFVTAEQASDAARRGERWATPRCISERQNQRLQQMTLMARAG